MSSSSPMHDLRLLALTMVSIPMTLAAQTGPVTIRAGRLLDGRGALPQNATIVVEQTQIRRVEHGAATSVVTYDLSRYTVLPGLIDGHAHLSWYFNRTGRFHTPNDGDTAVESMLAMTGNAFAT